MNPAERLHDHIRQEYPDASVELTSPLDPTGIWSIDIDLSDKHVAVEWSSTTGFAVSTIASEGFGERPDEAYASLGAIARRLRDLLADNKQTSPAYPLRLSWLRERRGMTQQRLAQKLGIRQATVSGIERRGDIQLSTLDRYLGGLGGRLEIHGVFADARYAIKPEDEHSASHMGAGHWGFDLTSTQYDQAFAALKEMGDLERATEIAGDIRSRGAVIEIP